MSDYISTDGLLMNNRIRKFLNDEKAVLVVILAAIAVRAVYLFQLHRSDLESILPLDMRFYRELALSLSRGDLPGGGLTFNPLYPLFLAAVVKVAGAGLLVPRIIQSAVGVAAIYVIYLAGKEAAISENRKEAGLIAASGALFYPQFLLYEGSFLGTSLVTFLLSLSLLLTLKLDRAASAGSLERGPVLRSGLPLGLILGAGALGRPNLFLILIPAVAAWFFFRPGSGRGPRLASAAVIAGSAAILIIPAGYNAARTGVFTPVTSHGGINFYIGNRVEGGGVYKPPEGMRMDMRGLVEDARARASGLAGREMTDREASKFWFSKGLKEIADNPFESARLIFRKFALFWNGTEIPDVIDISFYRDECPVMKILFIPFSVISALAICGLIAFYASGRNRGVMTVYIASAMASVLIFFVNSRYRVPTVPVMIIFGAVLVERVAAKMIGGRWKETVLILAGAAVLLFGFVKRDMVQVNRSAMYNFMGNAYIERGMEEKAEEMFEAAYRRAPQSVEARINYARILLRRGDADKAASLYRSAFRSFPQFPRLGIEYGAALLEARRVEQGRELFLWVYGNRPSAEKVMACRYLSRIAYGSGDRDKAAQWIRKALELVPGDRALEEQLHRLER